MFNAIRRVGQVPQNRLLTEDAGLSDSEVSAWNVRNTEIDSWWDWFTGEALKVVDEEAPAVRGKKPLIYPLQINLVRQAMLLHAHALAGEVPDTSDPLVRTVCDPKTDSDDARDLARKVEAVLRDVEYENHSRSMDTDMFLSVQALGAMVQKVGWDPDNPLLPHGVRWEYFDPREFYCRWQGTDYWNLTEAWIKQTISASAAQALGVKVGTPTATFIEYWDRSHYWIKVDGKLASVGGKVQEFTNPWGFVPFIYTPHLRANDFWGVSLVPDVEGLVREYNSRMADAGDALHLAVYDVLAMRNVKTGYPSETVLKDGTRVVNLGRAVTASDPEPDIFRPGSPKLPEGAVSFTESLLKAARHGQMTPDVAYGEDQGSQRSGATLHSRMWPMLSHIRQERTHWTETRNLRAEMSLVMMQAGGIEAVTPDMLGHRKRQIWAPPVPVDRAALVDELVKRSQQDAISLDLLIELFGDSPDPKKEAEAILAQVAARLKLEAEMTKLSQPDPVPPAAPAAKKA